jgi:integrase
MEKKALTEKAVANAKLPAGKVQADLWDAVLPGFGLRVGERKKSWNITYRIDGQQKRCVFGFYPAMTLAAARLRGGELRSMVDAGRDPAAELERERQEQADARANTVAAVVQRYLGEIGEVDTASGKRRPRQLRSGPEIKRIMMGYIVPVLGDRPMGELTRRELVKVLDDIRDNNGPAMANRTLGQIRKLFNFAVGKDIVAASPCGAIARPAPEVPRDRRLTDDEVRRVWKACDLAGAPYGAFVRFLLATGVRRSEAAFMTRSEIDGDVWVIPARRQKSNVEHAVPLSPLAMEIINSLPDRGPTVFALEGGGPMSGFSSRKAWFDDIVAADGDGAMEPWALHDIRRVVRSGMSALRIDPETAERVLAHVPARLRRTYDRHSYLDEKRAALEAWARRLQSIVDPTPKGNVFELRAAG